MARILIDGRFVGVGDSMTRYCLELLGEVLKLDRENDYTLLIRPIGEKKLDFYPDLQKANNLKVSVFDVPHYSKSEQTKLLNYLNQEKFDLVHFTQFNHPIFYKGSFVVTIHDLTLIEKLNYRNFVRQFAFNLVMKSAILDSKKIITISKSAKKDILDFCKVPEGKISLIHHGVDHARFSEQVKSQKSKVKSFKDQYHIAGDYILYAGAWKKHKNLIRLFEAFKLFKQKTKSPIQLVLTGKIDKNEPEVIAEIERVNKSLSTFHTPHSPVVTTGAIYDELPAAYAGALMYVIPSLAEGFGWPPLEAMACGTPVISSNVSCMPEILGDAPLYFDPYNVEEMAKAIEKVAGDEKLRTDLIKKGLEQVKKYDWSDTAKRTLEVYKEALISSKQ